MNIAEAIAAFLVVFIHFPFSGRAGSVVLAIARISVPFFYCVSGYFFFKGDTQKEIESIPRKIKKLGRLVCFSELAYLLFYVVLQIENIGFTFQAVTNVLGAELERYCEDLAAHLLVFSPLLNGVCWFVLSLCVVYIVAYVIFKCGWQHRALVLSIILLPAGILLRRIVVAAGITTEIPYERILPFLPFPFFMIGYYIHKYQQYFDSISNIKYGFALCFGVILTIMEQFYDTHTLYVGTPILVIGLIAFCGKNKDYSVKSYVGQYLSHIGSQTATYIYIMHMMVGNIVYVVLSKLIPVDQNHPVFLWGYPLITLAAAVICAEVISFLRKLIHSRW